MENETAKEPMNGPVTKKAADHSHDTQKEQGDQNGQEPLASQNDAEEILSAPEPSEVDRLKEELEALKKERDEHKDRFLRTVAEMENMRKRIDRERSELLRYGSEGLLMELLPVLDSFDKACGVEVSEEQNANSYLQGMLLVKKQLDAVLEKNGLTRIEAQGQPFDPNLHQAIQRIDSDEVAVDTVKDEYARGYRLHDRLLRPSMVSVLVPVAPKKD